MQLHLRAVNIPLFYVLYKIKEHLTLKHTMTIMQKQIIIMEE